MTATGDLAPAVRDILAAARDRTPPDAGPVSVAPRSFREAIAAATDEDRVPVIAEIKPTSPTTAGHRTDDPVELAHAMVEGGAAALSVLTEPEYFGGSIDTLREVRATVDVPVLRKDFILTEAELDAVEADLVLLIARFVGEELPELVTAAHDRGFQILVEAHTAAEAERAIEAGASIIGINNRDLGALEVDLGTFERVAPRVPDDVTLVAESGIASPDDVRRMRAAGADALLVGSSIMAGDVARQTARLAEAER